MAFSFRFRLFRPGRTSGQQFGPALSESLSDGKDRVKSRRLLATLNLPARGWNAGRLTAGLTLAGGREEWPCAWSADRMGPISCEWWPDWLPLASFLRPWDLQPWSVGALCS